MLLVFAWPEIGCHRMARCRSVGLYTAFQQSSSLGIQCLAFLTFDHSTCFQPSVHGIPLALTCSRLRRDERWCRALQGHSRAFWVILSREVLLKDKQRPSQVLRLT